MRVQDAGLRVQGAGVGAQGLGFRVQGLGLRVRVWGLGTPGGPARRGPLWGAARRVSAR